ncbi:MAG: ABC transporter substrate-binding protein [Chloroflexota bacterium]|nr:ABC transporter substrate-binding protein [Chloroflexota bacterium]
MTRRILLISLILLAIFAITACRPESVAPPTTQGAPAEPTQTSEPLTIKYPGDDWGYPSPFAFYPRGPGYTRMSFLFDTLVWKDEEGIIPWLAEDWQVSDDGTAWTFAIRSDVKFQDGEPLTVEDVVFSYAFFKEHMTAFKWNASLEKVKGVEAVSENGVAITLKEPFAGFLNDTAGSIPILPKHIWEDVEDPAKFAEPEAVIGSGPFTLTDYNREEGRYVYEANEDYFKGRPIIDRLVFVKVSDEALALETGTVDAASFWGKEIDVVKELRSDGTFEVLEGPSFWVLQLVFNTANPPFDKANVRQAVAQAIDRQNIVEQVTHGGAIVANLGIISPHTDWYNPNLPTYKHDTAEAKTFFEEQGLTTKPLTLITTANFAREAEMVKQDLEAVGLAIQLKTGDRTTVDTLLREGNFDLAINGHGGIANPSILDTPDWPAATYKNEMYDTLFAQQAQAVDQEKRRELVWQLQELLAEELPILPLYHPRMWLLYDGSKLDTWFYTAGGMSVGIPIPLNKLAFLPR